MATCVEGNKGESRAARVAKDVCGWFVTCGVLFD